MHFADFYLVLVFGFVSSLHCAQMCGPIVLTYSASLHVDRARGPLLWAHVAYNAGRIVTYMLLGAVAGAVGQTIVFGGRLAGLQNAATIIAGATMIIVGAVIIGLRRSPSFLGNLRIPSRLLRPIGALLSSRSPQSKFALGLLLGFMPCGLVYVALLQAVGASHSLGGAITMLAFGAGTSASLVAIGVGSSLITRKLARHGTALASATAIVLGALLVLRGTVPGALMFHR